MKLGLAADGLAAGEPDVRALEAEAPGAEARADGPNCVLAGELQAAAIRQARALAAAAKLFRMVSLSRFATRHGRVTGRVPRRQKHQEYRVAGCG